jgi:hypothetical protein
VRRHRLPRIDLHSHNLAPQGRQPRPGELVGEGARPVLGQPQDDRTPNPQIKYALTQYRVILGFPTFAWKGSR